MHLHNVGKRGNRASLPSPALRFSVCQKQWIRPGVARNADEGHHRCTGGGLLKVFSNDIQLFGKRLRTASNVALPITSSTTPDGSGAGLGN